MAFYFTFQGESGSTAVAVRHKDEIGRERRVGLENASITDDAFQARL